MKVPNAQSAVISKAKLVDYLLDIEHPRGGSKAQLLTSIGYEPGNPHRLANDIRREHLASDVVESRDSDWGKRFEIVAPLTGPTGDTVMFRSIWQIDVGTDYPRLITMYPE